jgi:histidyl-tRNA synthetase
MKPSIPKGTRDFSPQEMVKRNFIFDTIRKVYQTHGYQPIETPAMENLETLMGKYGDEGDRLIFKILNSGDYIQGLPGAKNEGNDLLLTPYSLSLLTKHISEKALRYDLTVPFARYVVQHRNDITFPFKRYQIQPVWRADRPQKGRYREFYQCDADVIGSDSLLNEVELIQIIDEVFTKLGIPIVIKINNRKLLQGIAEYIGAPDRMIDIAVAIDKLDKIGIDGVKKELLDKGFSIEQTEKLNVFVFLGKDKTLNINNSKYPELDTVKYSDFFASELCVKGINAIEKLLYMIDTDGSLNSKLQIDFSLARGLNYYTGTIIEVKVDTSKCASQFTSSLCGGGRYDDLTGVFGLPDISGVGISFGADRIYDVMEELNLFKPEIAISTKVLLLNFGENEAMHCLKVLKELHTAGISAELYPDGMHVKKINKQFEYADKRSIPYVVLIGQNEIDKGIVKLRIMVTKEEKEMTTAQLIEYLKST